MALRHAKLTIYDAATDALTVTAVHPARHTIEQAEAIVINAGTAGDATVDVLKNGTTILVAPIAATAEGAIYKGRSLAEVLDASPTMFEVGDVIEVVITSTTGLNVGASLRNRIALDLI